MTDVIQEAKEYGLPELSVILVGKVESSNLAVFKEKALSVIDNVKTDLVTDDDFAQADLNVKFFTNVEEKLEACKVQALSQTASIEELFKTVDTLKEATRSKRLTLTRLIEDRKKSIRSEIVATSHSALMNHINKLNEELGGKVRLPPINHDFNEAIKGKKTVTSLKQAAHEHLQACFEVADSTSDLIKKNLASLREHAKDYAFLFSDAQQLVLKDPEVVELTIKNRITEHTVNEEKRKEAELEQLRLEAEAKAEQKFAQVQQAPAEATVQVHAEAANDTQALAPSSGVNDGAGASIRRASIPAATTGRPTDDELIYSLALRFDAPEITIVQWLSSMDLQAAYAKRAEVV